MMMSQEKQLNCLLQLWFDYVGPEAVETCSEIELLKHIKDVAVKSIHKEVHRMAFNKMRQNAGKAITVESKGIPVRVPYFMH